MSVCEVNCRSLALSRIKRTFIDVLIGRSLDEKIDNFCHVNCIKTEGPGNFKKNGRWGFTPVFGFTEFFSSLFALISLVFNIIYFNTKIRGRLQKSPMRYIMKMQYYVCNSAFISSSLFHMRETTFTRYADYFTAFLSILVNTIVVINRLVIDIHPKIVPKMNRFFLVFGTIFFGFHVHKMAFVEFDYVYNKICCALMFFFLVTGDVILYFRQRHLKHSKNILIYLSWLILAGFTEILDISPVYFLIDSHAVWHLFMAISLPFYFAFISGNMDTHGKIKDE